MAIFLNIVIQICFIFLETGRGVLSSGSKRFGKYSSEICFLL